MELILRVDEKTEAERLVLVCAIGLLESLENDILTIEDCEKYLFSPYSVQLLKKKNLDEKVIEIIELGCELEDVQSLNPDKLSKNIRELKAQASKQLKVSGLSENQYDSLHWLSKE